MSVSVSAHNLEDFEAFLESDGWRLFEGIVEERLDSSLRALRGGKLSHDEYVAVCESIRTAEYLRDRPKQLVQQARMSQ